MKITVCIGSSCHLKGSRLVVEGLKQFIEERGLSDKIELSGTFCMGNCQKGVCVTVDDELHSVTPDNLQEFINNVVLKNL